MMMNFYNAINVYTYIELYFVKNCVKIQCRLGFGVRDMQSDSFEKALDDYLQTQNCDEIYEALYQFARMTFLAGWQAAKNDNTGNAQIIVLEPK